MAYAATVTVTVSTKAADGRKRWFVSIAETECAATSEWSVGPAQCAGHPLPEIGTITDYHAVKSAGTAATLRPILSRVTAPASTQVGYIGQQSAAAASVHDGSSVRYRGLATLYGRTTPDAGADNVIATEFVIVEGHF